MTVVNEIENELEYWLQQLFEGLDDVAQRHKMNSKDMSAELTWSLSDFDLVTEYRNWMAESWDQA